MSPGQFQPIIEIALAEDLGAAGDITSTAVIPSGSISQATIVSRAAGVLAGVEVGRAVFATIDPEVDFEARLADGTAVSEGDGIAVVSGRTRSMLAAERTALNLMCRMSGVATATAALVAAVAGTGARITDTRKTMPGLRILDKYSVTVGGGVNHRMGLFDAVMIKDNHIAAMGDIGASVSAARERVGPDVMIVVEIGEMSQLDQVIGSGADRVMLDNMSLDEMRRAVETVHGRLEVEASGGITLDNVRAVAATGVDVISVGWITHSAPQLDLALDFMP